MAEKEGLNLKQLIEEKTTRPSDATLRQAYAILAVDAETAEIEELMAVQAETLLEG